jgi:signal transduction histidine kinase
MRGRTWQSRLLILCFGLGALAFLAHTVVATARWLDEPFPGFFVYENLTVGPYHAPGWSGAAAGLRPLDRIIGIDGRALRDRRELYQVVRAVPEGTVLRYRARRAGTDFEVLVRSMTFAARDWMYAFGVYSLIGAAFLFIGVAPYFQRSPSAVALPLCFMVLLVFVWFQSTFDFMTSGALPRELRIFALALTPSAAIHLALLLRSVTVGLPLSAAHLALIYGAGALLAGVHAGLFFSADWLWIAIYRILYLYLALGALVFLVVISQALRRAPSDLDRSRLRVMLVGASLGFFIPTIGTVAASSANLPLPFNVVLIPSIFFPISIAYALLKYSLFDLGRTLKLAVSRFGLIVLLVAIYSLVALLFAPWAGQYARDPLVPVLFSILVVAIFNPLLRWLEGVVDRFIYRQDYDAAEVQAEISLFLRTLNDGAAVANGFAERIGRRLAIENIGVVYRPKNGRDFLRAVTPAHARAAAQLVNEFDAVRELFQRTLARSISRDEVSNDPQFCRTSEALVEIFQRCRADILMPLVYEREVRGMVCFGSKCSGHEYSSEDLRLLATLSEQLALSLENAQLYEESLAARRKAEASNRRLMEMDRIKKDFVANICHELRTPVSTIIGFSEVLRDPGFSGNAREILDKLINNGQELSSLMDNLMNFSRLEADGRSAELEIVKLGDVLGALELMIRRLIRQRPIEFAIRWESPVEAIESDGQKLQQILMQLLTNALKFTESGRIELSIRKRQQADTELLEIAVADTGIGIKREDQELIFEDFRQIEGSSTRRYGGTGLGLGLCKRLTAALGGEISVSSEYGVGSVFRVLLPGRIIETAKAA